MVIQASALTSNLDLFQATLVKDKLAYIEKQKNTGWIKEQDFKLINDINILKSTVAEVLALNTVVAIDTETEGLSVGKGGTDRLVGISFAWQKTDGKISARYVPILSSIDEILMDTYETLAVLKPLIERPSIYFNFMFDYTVFKKIGVEAQLLHDVSTMRYFTEKNGLDSTQFNHIKNSGLKECFKEVFGLDMLNLSDVLGKGVYNFSLAPLELSIHYATTDSFSTLRLYQHYLQFVDLDNFIFQLEEKLLRIVADMQYEGVGVDLELAKKTKAQILADNGEIEAKIYTLAGEKFNIGSPQMLSFILYEKLKLPVLKYIENSDGTDSDNPSTDKEALKGLKNKHEIIDLILQHKSNLKLVNTFLDKLSKVVGTDGNIHCSYRPMGAISGRFSSKAPNLQNLPKSADEDAYAFVIRKCFKANKGYYLLSSDFSQVEYKILAALSKSPELLKIFEKEGADVHKATASILFGTPLDEVTKTQRSKAKTLSFGLVYGLGPSSLAAKLSISEQEAKDLYESYFEKIPSVKSWIASIHSEILNTGITSSYYGRMRRLPEVKSSSKKKRFSALREGLNHKMQSTSADITKIAMVRCDKAIKGKNIKMLLQIHDQLIFEVGEEIEVSEAVALIRRAMELPIEGFPKLNVDSDVGYTWGTATGYKSGMTLDDIAVVDKLTISGKVTEKGIEIKDILSRYPGNHDIFIQVKDTVIRPESVDQKTGEISAIKVMPNRKMIKEVESLGLVCA